MSAGRLQRMLERAQSGLSHPLIELPARNPAIDRCQSAGASALCGTWADKPRGRRRNQRVAAGSEISLRRLGSFPFQVVLGDVSVSGCKIEMVEFVEVDDPVVARVPGQGPGCARLSRGATPRARRDIDPPIQPPLFEALLPRLA